MSVLPCSIGEPLQWEVLLQASARFSSEHYKGATERGHAQGDGLALITCSSYLQAATKTQAWVA